MQDPQAQEPEKEVLQMSMFDLDRALIETITARVALERLPARTKKSIALDRILERQQLRQLAAVKQRRAEILKGEIT